MKVLAWLVATLVIVLALAIVGVTMWQDGECGRWREQYRVEARAVQVMGFNPNSTEAVLYIWSKIGDPPGNCEVPNV